MKKMAQVRVKRYLPERIVLCVLDFQETDKGFTGHSLNSPAQVMFIGFRKLVIMSLKHNKDYFTKGLWYFLKHQPYFYNYLHKRAVTRSTQLYSVIKCDITYFVALMLPKVILKDSLTWIFSFGSLFIITLPKRLKAQLTRYSLIWNKFT